MDDSLAVGVGDRLGDLLEHREEPGTVHGRARALFEQLVQGAATNQLHGQERPAIRGSADLVNGRDRRVLKLRGDERFLDKALRRLYLTGEALLKELHRHVALQRQIASPIDDAHATAANLIQKLVARRRCLGPCRSPSRLQVNGLLLAIAEG